MDRIMGDDGTFEPERTMKMTARRIDDDVASELPAANVFAVSTFSSDGVSTIGADASVAEAARALTTADLGLLVVGSVDDVQGVISERDVVHAVAGGRDLDTFPVRELETTDLIWCDSTASVDDVAELMLEHYVRHVLVEKNGKFVGVVSARDLLGALAGG